jgi:hypothetical protein
VSAVLALADDVEGALASLPTTAPEIAALFDELSISGQTRMACACPVANYLGGHLKDGAAGFTVTQVDVTVDHETEPGETAVVEMPPHVGEFVRRFDNGDYPHLERANGYATGGVIGARLATIV